MTMLMKMFDIGILLTTLTIGLRFLIGILAEVWRQCLMAKLRTLSPDDHQMFYQLQTAPRPWYVRLNGWAERWERRVIS